jgi:uncharacterized RDD family membrane protein YckC
MDGRLVKRMALTLAGVAFFAALGTLLGHVVAPYMPTFGPVSGQSLGLSLGFIVAFLLINRFVPDAFPRKRG